MADKRGWSRLYYEIVTREDAVKTIKDASTAFFVMAAIQLVGIVVILQQYSAVIDVALMAILAFLLRRFASRLVAVVLLLLALGEAGVTVANRLGVTSAGGTNILLGAILLWAAIRAVQATFKLHKLSESDKALTRT